MFAVTYPQQPHPQQPVGQGYYAQQWGAAQAPVPPPPRRRGAAVGLIAGVVVLVAVVGLLGYFKASAGRRHPVGPPVRYTIAAAATIPGGYTLKKQEPSTDPTETAELVATGIAGPTVVNLDYSGPGDTIVAVVGISGTVADPATTLDRLHDSMQKDLSQSEGGGATFTFVGVPQAFKPTGLADGLMKCQFMHVADDSGTHNGEMCVWTDRSTAGTALIADDSTLSHAADTLAAIRTAIRVPAPKP
jgi:hypothetical protein